MRNGGRWEKGKPDLTSIDERTIKIRHAKQFILSLSSRFVIVLTFVFNFLAHRKTFWFFFFRFCCGAIRIDGTRKNLCANEEKRHSLKSGNCLRNGYPHFMSSQYRTRTNLLFSIRKMRQKLNPNENEILSEAASDELSFVFHPIPFITSPWVMCKFH